MKKDRIKSIFLAVLFTISLVLTQRLWFYLPFGDMISTANDVDSKDIDINVTDILSPQNFVISFGGGDYTVFFSEPYEVWNIGSIYTSNANNTYDKKDIWIWETSKEVLKDYLSDDYEVEEISYDQWEKVKKFKSIIMNFACEIPGDSLINELVGYENDSKIKDEIDTILILPTEDEKNNIYLASSEKNKYYKVVNNRTDSRIRTLIDNIEAVGEEKGYIDYVTLQSTSRLESDVLIPVFDDEATAPIPAYSSKNQIDVSDKIAVKNQAYQFFGTTFDFVKEINEIDGTVIYMYGYGERALKLNKNGTLEYTEKLDKDKIGSNLNFVDSLKYATKFIEEKGGKWPVNIKNTYLSDYEIIEQGNEKGYIFSFNYRLKGLPIFIPDIAEDKAIQVKIIGKQITEYKRTVKNPPQKLNSEEKDFLSIFSGSQDRIILNITDVLRKNNDNIKNNYVLFSGKKLEEDQDFKIDELIKHVGMVYYSYDDRLTPAWEITIDNIVYYFDLYTGEIYTFTIKNN